MRKLRTLPAIIILFACLIDGTELNGSTVDLSEELSLGEVLRLAVTNNFRIRAAKHRWEAAKQEKSQAITPPDPALFYSHYVRGVETRTGPMQWTLGVSQTIPFPQKMILAGQIADRDSRIAYLRYEAEVRNALAEAKERFFELYYIDRAVEVTEAISHLYDQHLVLAGTDQKGTSQGIFRAETQKAQLEYDLVLLREMRTTEEEALRVTLGLSVDRKLGRTRDIEDPVPLGERIERLQEVAERHNQEFLAAGITLERAELSTKLAKRAAIPDLTFSVGYTSIGTPFFPNPVTGRDPLTVGVGVSLPIYFWKYRAQARQAREREQAAEFDLEAKKLQLRANLARSCFRLRNASRLVQLYRDTLLPQAHQAINSAEELYRVGQNDLRSLLETTSTYHNFELARLRATADYYQNVARLERVLGTAMDLRPGAAEGGRP
jgi:outer membrane protein TolC